jgi:hypothetical protein
MIIWLSSYPKSGNTWVRSIISSILYSQDGKHSFKNMEMIEQYPIRKQFTGLISNFHSINEIKKNWISSQERINIDGKIKFFKTHHVNCTIDNDPFTNNSNTTGVIYIVRDPRNVITSLKYHFSIENYDIAKKMLFSNDQAIGTKLNNNSSERNFLTLIGSWGAHYNSWKNTKKNFLLIRYEDLLVNPKNEIEKILLYLKNFFKINIDQKKINNVLNTTSFDNLKKMENMGLFKEGINDKITGNNKKFFNLGPNNDWNKVLDGSLAEEIVNKFQKEMKELKYI